MLAREIVDRLRIDGTIKEKLVNVRRALGGCRAFAEVTRGRWCLGVAISAAPWFPPPQALAEWFWRAHAATLPQRKAPDLNSQSAQG
jgi:hypothetical protein